MGVAALKIKFMPESPDTDLEKLKAEIKISLKKQGAIRIESIEEEDIAFGLTALIITIAWPEDFETEKIENLKIKGISSVQIIDYRRAFG